MKENRPPFPEYVYELDLSDLGELLALQSLSEVRAGTATEFHHDHAWNEGMVVIPSRRLADLSRMQEIALTA